MKYPRNLEVNFILIYRILAVFSLLCLLTFIYKNWLTKKGNYLPQWWNQNLETFRRELVETNSGHQQKILNKSGNKLDKFNQHKKVKN